MARLSVVINISNNSDYDVKLIPIRTSGVLNVVILATDNVARGCGTLGPPTWFNPHWPGLQSRALYGVVCTLSIANINIR